MLLRKIQKQLNSHVKKKEQDEIIKIVLYR